MTTPAPRKSRRPSPLSLAAWRQFLKVAKPYWLGEEKTTAWLLLALLIALMLVETELAVRLNNQAGEMTSALAARDGGRFWQAVRDCLLILAFAIPVYAFYYYMRDLFANQWRRWLTGRFLDGYLRSRKYYELVADSEIDNPDQRISEDLTSSAPSRYRSPTKAGKGEDSYVASTRMRQGRFGGFLLHRRA